MRTRLNTLEGKVDGFEQKLDDQQVIVNPPDPAPVLDMIREEGSAMRKEMTERIKVLSDMVESQPKPIVRQWRLSLFPEWDHTGSWKHFINWLFAATLGALLVGALYALGSQYMQRMHPAQTVTEVPSAPAGSGAPEVPSGKKGEMRTKKVRGNRVSDAKRISPDTSKMP
jgi:hypothetical protein